MKKRRIAVHPSCPRRDCAANREGLCDALMEVDGYGQGCRFFAPRAESLAAKLRGLGRRLGILGEDPCYRCRYEDNCAENGCAILREAEKRIGG